MTRTNRRTCSPLLSPVFLSAALWLVALAAVGRSPEAIARYEEGIRLAETEKNYRSAIDALEEALTLDPNFPEAALSIGQCYGQLAELDKAARYFEQALNMKPEAPLAFRITLALGEVRLLLGRYDAAKSALRRAAEIDPTNLRVQEGLGEALAKSGELDAAIEAYRAALRLDPQSVRAERGLAAAYAEKGDAPRTIEHAEKAIHLDRFDAATYFVLAKALIREKRRDEATAAMDAYRAMKRYEEEITTIEKHLRESGFAPSLRTALAERHAAEGNIDAAIRVYEAMAADGIDPATSLTNIGLLELSRGRLDAAEKRFRDAVDLDADAAGPRIGLGKLYMAQKRWGSAKAAFRAAIDRDPTLDVAHLGLLEALARIGDREGLVAALEQWTKHAPNSSLAWSEWGLLNYRLGHLDEALNALEKALALEPENVGIANNLAWIYAAQGTKLDRALELARNVVEAEPTASAYDTLGTVREARGELDAALDARRQAVALDPENTTYRDRLAALERKAQKP